MIRISLATDHYLDEIAKISGMHKQAIVERAVEAFLRDQFIKKANEEFASMQADPTLWEQELKERNAWNTTSSDGLEDI